MLHCTFKQSCLEWGTLCGSMHAFWWLWITVWAFLAFWPWVNWPLLTREAPAEMWPLRTSNWLCIGSNPSVLRQKLTQYELLPYSATHIFMISLWMWCILYTLHRGFGDWMDLCKSLRSKTCHISWLERCFLLSWPPRGWPAACDADGAEFWWQQHFGAFSIGAQSRLIPSSHFSFRPERPYALEKQGGQTCLGASRQLVRLKVDSDHNFQGAVQRCLTVRFSIVGSTEPPMSISDPGQRPQTTHWAITTGEICSGNWHIGAIDPDPPKGDLSY